MSLRHWTLGDWWLLAMALYALVLGAYAWLHGRYRYHTGWEDGRDYQKSRDINARLRDRSRDNPAIRSKGGSVNVPPEKRAAMQTSLVRGREEVRRREEGRHRPQRVVTTAADIAPVIYPHGAAEVPLRPQAAADPTRRTAAMDMLTDTGWMRAIEAETNERIHHMRADGAQYRRNLRARDAAQRPERPAPGRMPGAGPPGHAGRIVFGDPRDRPGRRP